jgi:hypothetical protein
MDLREIEWSGIDCINLTQDRHQLRALVNTIMNLGFRKTSSNSWVAKQLGGQSSSAHLQGVSFYAFCFLIDRLCGLVVKSSWLQIQRSGLNFRRYQISWEVVGLERGPPSQELLGKKSSGSGLEIREYGLRDPSRWPRGTLYPQKLAVTLPTSGGRSVGIVRLRTQWGFSPPPILV